MAKLETEITVNVRDLPEVQQTLRECVELRDAAREYMRVCPADPDTTPAFQAATERLRAAIATLTPDGVDVPAEIGQVCVCAEQGITCKWCVMKQMASGVDVPLAPSSVKHAGLIRAALGGWQIEFNDGHGDGWKKANATWAINMMTNPELGHVQFRRAGHAGVLGTLNEQGEKR